MSLPHIPHFTAHLLHFEVVVRGSIYCHFLHRNVVGYSTTATISGNKIYGGQFALVNGSTGLKLSDITVTGYTMEEGEFTGLVVASKLDAYGATPTDADGNFIMWTWAAWEEEDDQGNVVTYSGWVDSLGEFCGDSIDIPLGSGLWIQSDNAQWKIQSAGEVYGEAVPCQLLAGNRICANPCPANITLDKCVVTGYELEEGEFTGLVVASKLDAYGATPTDADGNFIMWTWADWEEDDGEGGTIRYSGWVDALGEFCGDKIDVEMGSGLWVQSDSASYNFVFPTALEN